MHSPALHAAIEATKPYPTEQSRVPGFYAMALSAKPYHHTLCSAFPYDSAARPALGSTMAARTSYKTALIDWLGPDSADVMKAVSYGAVMFVASFVLLFVIGSEMLPLRAGKAALFAFSGAAGLGALVAIVPLAMAHAGAK